MLAHSAFIGFFGIYVNFSVPRISDVAFLISETVMLLKLGNLLFPILIY